MKNGEIKVDKNGKKWVWINSAFYIYDDRNEDIVWKEGMKDFKNIIEQFTKILKLFDKCNGVILNN